MKLNNIIIAGLVLTNLGTIVYFRDHRRRVEAAAEDQRTREQRQTEIVALTEKLAASERALAELKPPAFGALRTDPARRAEAVRRQNSPVQRAARAAEQRQIAQRQFSAFIKKSSLSEGPAETLLQLIVELRQAPRDEFERRQSIGLPIATGDESRRITRDAQQPVFESIRTLLGDDAYQAFEYYSRTLTERQLLEQMTHPVQLSEQPLSEVQFDAVVDALSAAKHEVMAANGGFMPLGESVDAVSQRYATVIKKSRAFLSDAQRARVQQMFDDDIAVKRLRASAAAERGR